MILRPQDNNNPSDRECLLNMCFFRFIYAFALLVDLSYADMYLLLIWTFK